MCIVCKQTPDTITLEKSETGFSSSPVIVCRNCGHVVSCPDHCIQMNGMFLHTFANPQGHVFEIGCFNQAEGCIPASQASMEFTWFSGYAWRIGVCANCAGHLGWIFTCEGDRFFGLIVDKLIFP